MTQVFPTKANLMHTKKSLELAKQGYDLMDRKRNILVREMMARADEADALQSQIGAVYEQAYAALKQATLHLGDCAKYVGAIPCNDDLTIEYRSVMGVEVPMVTLEETPTDVRSFGFAATNSDFDEACRRFCEVKRLTARLAELENGVCRLADAVKKTRKRSNALSNIMIPRLEATVKSITEALDEKEREDFSRLKVVKSKKDSGKSGE
ncbi:MAG: V-type ATP synthase subunit D [Clostridia bacterium]|nr:V-type ATP synthase subunit D [Clostridia bacterium]